MLCGVPPQTPALTCGFSCYGDCRSAASSKPAHRACSHSRRRGLVALSRTFRCPGVCHERSAAWMVRADWVLQFRRFRNAIRLTASPITGLVKRFTSASAEVQVSSLKDVAAEAGVSVATVSRLLNGSLKLPEKTHQRIQKAVEKLDYQPNPHARWLSRGQSDAIGLVIPDIANPVLRNAGLCGRRRGRSARNGVIPLCDAQS